MSPRGLRAGVRRLFRLPLRTSSQVDADADEELRAFLAERVDYLVARGMAPDEAVKEAVRRLGGSVEDAAASLHNSAMDRERHMRARELSSDLEISRRQPEFVTLQLTPRGGR